MALNFTVEEIKARKEKAVALLNTHADKYRTLYSQIAVVSEPTDEQIEQFQLKRKWLEMESDSIHSQISMLNELQYYAEQEEKASERVAES